jgi:hypothetical protein
MVQIKPTENENNDLSYSKRKESVAKPLDLQIDEETVPKGADNGDKKKSFSNEDLVQIESSSGDHQSSSSSDNSNTDPSNPDLIDFPIPQKSDGLPQDFK